MLPISFRMGLFFAQKPPLLWPTSSVPDRRRNTTQTVTSFPSAVSHLALAQARITPPAATAAAFSASAKTFISIKKALRRPQQRPYGDGGQRPAAARTSGEKRRAAAASSMRPTAAWRGPGGGEPGGVTAGGFGAACCWRLCGKRCKIDASIKPSGRACGKTQAAAWPARGGQRRRAETLAASAAALERAAAAEATAAAKASRLVVRALTETVGHGMGAR